MLLDPIFHDDKDDAVRFVESVWPHVTYPFLYGSVPQTWEDPNFEHEFTGYPGDNDPVDMFDISGLDKGYVGQVKQVKILGGLAMIDVSGLVLGVPARKKGFKVADLGGELAGRYHRLEDHCH